MTISNAMSAAQLIRSICPGSRPKLFCRSATERARPITIVASTAKGPEFGRDFVIRQAYTPGCDRASTVRALKEGDIDGGFRHERLLQSGCRDAITGEGQQHAVSPLPDGV